MEKSAFISDCGLYRYSLSRKWGGAPDVCFVMLNPSTADANLDDPTIRRCIGFARSWGRGGIKVINLFAFRATSPKDLKAAVDPVGRLNEKVVVDTVLNSIDVVCAWGVHGSFRGQAKIMMGWIDRGTILEPYALALTKDGHPRHPLYLPKNAERQPFQLTF